MAERSSPTMVRNLDPDLLRQVRAEAVRLNVTTGELLNDIIHQWLLEHVARPKQG